MKFEIRVKHNRENIDKAIEIIDTLKAMARARKFDMSNEMDIHIDVSEAETVEIYPNLFLENNELYPQNGRDFQADYLEKYANDKSVLVDLLSIVQKAS